MITANDAEQMLLAFIITAAVEGIAAFLYFRSIRGVYCSFVCNMLTNPMLNVILLLATANFGTTIYVPLLVLLELIAVLAEAKVYSNIMASVNFKKSIVISACFNALSFTIGIFLI